MGWGRDAHSHLCKAGMDSNPLPPPHLLVPSSPLPHTGSHHTANFPENPWYIGRPDEREGENLILE